MNVQKISRRAPLWILEFAVLTCFAASPEARSATPQASAAPGDIVRDPDAWRRLSVRPRVIPANGSVSTLAFSPDGASLFSWQMRTHAVHIHEVATGKELRKFDYPAVHVHVLSVAPDGRSMASGDTTSKLLIWDLEGGKVARTLGEFDGAVGDAQYSPGGRNLAALGSGLQVFEVSTGKTLLQAGGYHWHQEKAPSAGRILGPTEWYSSLAWSLDGQSVASAHSGSLEGKDWDSKWTVRVWKLPGGTEPLQLDGHQGKVTGASFSPDGRRLATVGQDRTLRIWDLARGREAFHVALEDAGAPRSVAFLPGGQRLAVGMSSHFDSDREEARQGDCAIRFYDAASGKGLGRLRAHDGGVESMTLSSDGRSLASVGMRGPIYLWEVAALDSAIDGPSQADNEEFKITPEAAEAIVREVRPLVEEKVGRTLKEAPRIVLSTPATVAEILSHELDPQLQVQLPDLAPEKRQTAVRQSGEILSKILLGKYEEKTQRIHVLERNFIALAERLERPILRTRAFLRLILIHELVHALDQQEHGIFTRLAQLKTTDEFIVWNTVIEGHAQHVTRAILAGEGKEKLFSEYEEILRAGSPADSEGEKFITQMLSTYTQAAYLDGRKFFDAQAASGHKTYVDDVFTRAPESMDVILRPERYYDPKAARSKRDCSALFDELAKGWPDLRATKQKVGQLEVRSSFGDFVDPKQVEAASGHITGGQALILAADDGSKMVVFMVLELDERASAAKLGELLGQLSRAKEKRLTQGNIRITKVNRGPLKAAEGATSELTRMTVQVGDQSVLASDVVGVLGPWVIEELHSNDEASDEKITGNLNRIIDFLKSEK